VDKISLRDQVISLRKKGKTYSEIRKKIKKEIPKSTLSYWCKNIYLSPLQQERINKCIKVNIEKGRMLAILANRKKRERYLNSVRDRIKDLKKIILDKNVAKIALAMLYLGEGTKSSNGSLTFGNSSPEIINLFLRLLRFCYKINESKFRCTLQCRADQNIKVLEKFWSAITEIPIKQFYKARVDQRTIGKPSKNTEYKGVCRIDYFSADLYTELTEIAKTV